MSLLSLRKPSPPAEPESSSGWSDVSGPEPAWDVDDFIEGALDYAAGNKNVISLRQSLAAIGPPSRRQQRCKRATFTLTDEARDKLALLSCQTGIPKSRLIRIWLSGINWQDDPEAFISSRIR